MHRACTVLGGGCAAWRRFALLLRRRVCAVRRAFEGLRWRARLAGGGTWLAMTASAMTKRTMVACGAAALLWAAPASAQEGVDDSETHPGSQGIPVQGVPEGTPVEIVAPPAAAPQPPAVVVMRSEEPKEELPYEEGDPIPEGYKLTTKSYNGLLIAGGVTFGVLYGLSAAVGIAAMAEGDDGGGMLLIPVAGPFIAAGTLDSQNDFKGPGVVAGLGQAAGLTLLTLGLVLDKQVLRRLPVTPAAAISDDLQLLGAAGRF